MKPAIDVQKVFFSYARKNILANVQLSIQWGERIVLTGENGAGKTTFLKLLATILKPTAGIIKRFDGRSEEDVRSFRKKLGLHFDDSHLLGQLTVLENINLYQRLYTGAVNSSMMDEWLNLFDLDGYRKTQVQKLSQGEQKKLSLIKAFSHHPAFILLDEPTNSLDAASKEKLAQALLSLDEKRVLIVSTHDGAWANSWKTRNIHIRNGNIE